MLRRKCDACCRVLLREDFSKRQWTGKSGAGARRCEECVQRGRQASVSSVSSVSLGYVSSGTTPLAPASTAPSTAPSKRTAGERRDHGAETLFEMCTARCRELSSTQKDWARDDCVRDIVWKDFVKRRFSPDKTRCELGLQDLGENFDVELFVNYLKQMADNSLRLRSCQQETQDNESSQVAQTVQISSNNRGKPIMLELISDEQGFKITVQGLNNAGRKSLHSFCHDLGFYTKSISQRGKGRVLSIFTPPGGYCYDFAPENPERKEELEKQAIQRQKQKEHKAVRQRQRSEYADLADMAFQVFYKFSAHGYSSPDEFLEDYPDIEAQLSAAGWLE